MSLSIDDINILRNAIQKYQTAVKNRDVEKQAQREAARLRREENMKAIGSFFKGISSLAVFALVVYVLFQIDWGTVFSSIGSLIAWGIGIVVVLFLGFMLLGGLIVSGQIVWVILFGIAWLFMKGRCG